MKNAFRKMRGKKDDEDGNKRLSRDSRGYSGLPSALQNMNLSSGSSAAQSRTVAQHNVPSGSAQFKSTPLPRTSNVPSGSGQSKTTPLPQTANVPSGSGQYRSTPLPQTSSTASPSSGRLNARGSVPFAQLGPLLAAPASSTTPEEARELCEIPLPALCPICYNFDPYQAPRNGNASEHQKSWAKEEYKIPQGIPVAKITVEKSEELIESAKRGCFYCSMVFAALGAVSPGWENEKSFIHIFLAPRLPVYVRLEFGVTSTVTLGREGMLGLGIELQEGQTMNFIITVGDPSKPAIDVEIYRPYISPDQKIIADLVLEPLVEHMGTAEEIPEHAGDEKCFDFIKEQVATCMKEHKCGKDGHLPLLPDRVIWIEANQGSAIQLVEPKNIRAKYIALSYCWGPVTPSTYLTDVSTYNTRKAGIVYVDLPPLIQDVVSCARKLGIEYVWVDRLCIIQGDVEDFKSQAPKMGEIYGNATLTIAAATATSETERILVGRETKWQAYDLGLNIDGIGSLTLRFRRRTHPLGKEDSGGEYGKISTRAWAWQERLLSARTIFYTPSALKFECRCYSIWQGFGRGLTGHSWSSKLDNISHQSWTTLVEEYMSRNITRPSDRLPAMEAAMKRIERSQGWSPLWGMWANALVESLGWESWEHSGRVGSHAGRMNPGHYAPTWSWASVDGRISHVSAKPAEDVTLNDPRVYDLEIRKLNAASGLITVAGHVILVELSCRIEVGQLDDGETLQEGLKYYYEVLGVYADAKGPKAFPMKPDVALKPWNGDVNGRHIETIIRVPYGEEIPEKSWTAHCLCLLVSKNRLRSLVLFLGASLREPGGWERIGMVDGLHPGIFGNSQRQTINIV
ncbi:HET-domain-containing protein [Stipitochalara longipes BDJ]|nr:HET-domain-containing protein [Stipitochalara longipes BDJ]